jgi:sigma-B regulation protein RsbU (phosphoserine phosphatase)
MAIPDIAAVIPAMRWAALILALLLLAALLRLLYRGYRARKLLERRVAELSALSDAGRAIVAAQLDVDELCVLIYHQARRIVDTWIFQLGFFENNHYRIKVWIKEGQRHPETVFDLEEGEGIVGWLRRTGQPLLVRDFAAEIDTLPARPRYTSDAPPRSAVFVPLVTGETVIGAMAIQSHQPAAFTEDHQRVLSIIANQAAAAIANARLYASERRRRQMADRMHRLSQLVNASLETDEVLDAVLQGLEGMLTFDAAALFLLDQDRVLSLRAARGLPALLDAVGQNWSLGETRRLRRLVETRQSHLFGADDKSGIYHRLLDLPPDHSCLGMPITIRDRLVGVLTLESRQSGRYDAEDVALVAAVAGHAASALENARLYAAGQEEAWISTALLEVAEATSLAKSVDDVLETVVRITPLLVGVDRCVILLLNDEEAAFEVAASFEPSDAATDLGVGRILTAGDWPLLDQMWRSGSPVVDEFGGIPGAPATQDVETTLLALPLRAQGELMGAMIIGFTGQVSFSEHRLKLIAGIANQAALAMERARLVLAQEEEAWVSLALLQVAEAVANLSDLEDVLDVVTRLTPLLVGVESCLVYLWDEAGEQFVPGAAYGLDAEGLAAFQTGAIPASDWPQLCAVRSDETRSDSPIPLPSPMANGLPLDAPVAVPLQVWGEMMGAMVVDTRERAMLGEKRFGILSGVAGQTATAIQNTRLQNESVERQKLERELQLARQIQASFLPARVPDVPGWDLAAYWQGARQVSGDFYDFVALAGRDHPDGRWGFVVADVADKGMPAALFMALSRTLVRTMAIGGDSPDQVLVRANDMIMSDSRSDLFVTLFYAILEPGPGRLCYANAGHNPPLHFKTDSKTVIELEAHGMAMGVLTGIELEQREVWIQPGELLLLYTDGVTDALNGAQEEFGLERLRDVVTAHRLRSAPDVVDAVIQAVSEFVGETPQFDDLTLVLLKRQT